MQFGNTWYGFKFENLPSNANQTSYCNAVLQCLYHSFSRTYPQLPNAFASVQAGSRGCHRPISSTVQSSTSQWRSKEARYHQYTAELRVASNNADAKTGRQGLSRIQEEACVDGRPDTEHELSKYSGLRYE